MNKGGQTGQKHSGLGSTQTLWTSGAWLGNEDHNPETLLSSLNAFCDRGKAHPPLGFCFGFVGVFVWVVLFWGLVWFFVMCKAATSYLFKYPSQLERFGEVLWSSNIYF